MTMERLTIDGSYGEGGGQILRTSASLSAVLGRPVEVVKVRAGRTKPGLQPAHLMALRAAAAICAGRLEGDEVGSSQVVLEPGGPVAAGNYFFDVGTAGSTSLVLQTVLLPLALASGPSRVVVRGGTHNEHAPVYEYLEQVYLPTLAELGVSASLRCEQAGHFPRGGGEVALELAGGARLRMIAKGARGKLRSLRALIVTSSLPPTVAERAAGVVGKALAAHPVQVETIERPAPSPGAAVMILAETDGGRGGFTGYGKRGKPMEAVAQEACDEFLTWWGTGAACEEHLADQLVLPAALGEGGSWSSPALSGHLETVLWLVPQFLPFEVSVEEREGRVQVQTRKS